LKIKTFINNAIFILIACVIGTYAISSCGSSKSSISTKSHDVLETTVTSNEVDTQLKYADSLFYKGVFLNNIQKYDSALVYLKEFAKLYPHISATYYQMARSHLGKNSSVETINKLVSTAYELDPSNKWYMLYYANIISLKGKHLEAAQIYSELIQQGNYEKEYFMRAFLNYEKAEAYDSMLSIIHQMDQYTDLEDEFIKSITLFVRQLQKDTTYVEDYYIKKLETSENNVENLMELYDLYYSTGQEEKKQAILEQIDYFKIEEEELRGKYLSMLMFNYEINAVKPILFNLFVEDTLKSNPELEFVTKIFVEVLAHNPRCLQSYFSDIREWSAQYDSYRPDEFLVGYYQYLEEKDSALYYMERAFDKGYRNISYFEVMYAHYVRSNDTLKAQQLSQKGMESDPNFIIAYYYKAIEQYQVNDYKGAYENILIAIDRFDTVQYKLQFLSQLYGYAAELGQKNHVDNHTIKDYFIKALEINKNDITILNNYAYYLSEYTEDLDLADSLSYISLKASPRNASFLDTYGWIKYMKGDYEIAKKYILLAIENDGNSSPVLLEHLGDVEIKLNNISKGIELYKKALRYYENDEAEKLKQKLQKYEK